MCGLFGIASTGLLSENEKRYFEELGKLSTSRGKDSTGVATIKQVKFDSNKTVNFWYNIVKDVCEPSYFFNRKEWREVRKLGHNIYLGHNRAATIGKVTKAAAHPFQIKLSDEDGTQRLRVIGMHNGTIHDYLTKTEEKEEKYLSDSHKFYTTAAETSFRDALLQLKERSSYCFIYMDNTTCMPTFFRNTERPLWFARTKSHRTIVWASEKRFLEAADKMHSLNLEEPYMLEPNILTSLNLTGEKVVLQVAADYLPKEKIELHQKRYTPYVSTYHNGGTYRGGGNGGYWSNGVWKPYTHHSADWPTSSMMGEYQDWEYDDEEKAWRAQLEQRRQDSRDLYNTTSKEVLNDEIPFRPDPDNSKSNVLPFLPRRVAESEIDVEPQVVPVLSSQCGDISNKKIVDIDFYQTNRRFKVTYMIDDAHQGVVYLGPENNKKYEWACGVYRFFEHERLRVPFVMLAHDDVLWVYLNSNPRKAKIKKIGKKHPNFSGWWQIWEEQEEMAENWLRVYHQGPPLAYEDLFEEPGLNYNYLNKLASKYTKEIREENKKKIVEALQKKKNEEALEAKMKEDVDNFLENKKEALVNGDTDVLPRFLQVPAVRNPITIKAPSLAEQAIIARDRKSVTEEEVLTNLPGLFRSEFGRSEKEVDNDPPISGGTIARLNRGISKPPFSYYDNGFGQFGIDRASLKLSNGCDCCDNPKLITDLVWWITNQKFVCNDCWTVEQWKDQYKMYSPKRGKLVKSDDEGGREIHVG